MQRINQRGIGHVLVVLLVLAVAVIGFTGYKVYESSKSPDVLSKQATSKSANVDQVIQDSPELKEADASLKEVDASLSRDMNSAVLDEDIQSLL